MGCLAGNHLEHERAVTATEERGRACCCSTVLAAARNYAISLCCCNLLSQSGASGAGDYLPSTSEPSGLLEEAHLCALAAAVPLRHRWRRWRLVYATARDGISLTTLYRHAFSFACVAAMVLQ